MNNAEGEETLIYANTIHPITEWNRVLYIGMLLKTLKTWRGDFFLKFIKEHNPNFRCDVIEIEPNNIVALDKFSNEGIYGLYNIQFFLGDIVNFVKRPLRHKYDCVIWWHGPEHLTKESSLKTLQKFDNICKGISILGCPLGNDPYKDPVTGDSHLWDVNIKDLTSIGFKCITIDRTPYPIPSISAFKDHRNE